MKPKIMHYYTDDQAGGPATYIKTICTSILSNEFDFSCCYQYKPMKNLKLSDFKRIIQEIKTFQPDILHIHGLQGEGFIGVVCGKFAKVPTILTTVHGMQNDSITNSKLKTIVYKNLIEKMTLRWSDYVYCVCQSAEKNQYIQKNAKYLLKYIWNCVDDLPIYDREKIRLELGIEKNDHLIISVGRVTEMKGSKELTEIIRQSDRINERFLIVGDGIGLSQMKNVLKSEEQMKKVIFTGNVSDVGRYLCASDIFVTASYKENLSIAILEAGYYGIPCIVTDVGGNSEIIENMQTGLLVPARNIESLMQSIRYYEDNTVAAKQHGEKLKSRIKSDFSKNEFTKRISQMYRMLIECKN